MDFWVQWHIWWFDTVVMYSMTYLVIWYSGYVFNDIFGDLIQWLCIQWHIWWLNTTIMYLMTLLVIEYSGCVFNDVVGNWIQWLCIQWHVRHCLHEMIQFQWCLQLFRKFQCGNWHNAYEVMYSMTLPIYLTYNIVYSNNVMYSMTPLKFYTQNVMFSRICMTQ